MPNITTITTDRVHQHVNGLQAIGTQMERDGDPRWLPIAQAAAMLEGLRLGLVLIVEPDATPPASRWIGIDTAKPGKDRSAHMTGDCHA